MRSSHVSLLIFYFGFLRLLFFHLTVSLLFSFPFLFFLFFFFFQLILIIFYSLFSVFFQFQFESLFFIPFTTSFLHRIFRSLRFYSLPFGFSGFSPNHTPSSACILHASLHSLVLPSAFSFSPRLMPPASCALPPSVIPQLLPEVNLTFPFLAAVLKTRDSRTSGKISGASCVVAWRCVAMREAKSP